MKQYKYNKQHRKKMNLYLITPVVIIVTLAGAAVISLTNRSATEAQEPPKIPTGAAVPSEFEFTGAADWWQGATSKTSMALFHREHDGCFVSFEHHSGAIADKKDKIQKTRDGLVSDGYKVASVGSKAMAIQMPGGIKHYELEQSTVTTPEGANKILGGQEFGYLQLGKGYLFVQVHCEEPNQLPAVIPALNAVKFDPAGTEK